MTELLFGPIILGMAAILVMAAWSPYRNGQWMRLALIWAGFAAIYGYISYRMTCSLPLTCDVGSVADYLPRLWPRYSLIGGLAFGGAVLAVALGQRASPPEPLWPRTLVLGSLATVGTWTLANAIFAF